MVYQVNEASPRVVQFLKSRHNDILAEKLGFF
jgi:hypothetical protein